MSLTESLAPAEPHTRIDAPPSPLTTHTLFALAFGIAITLTIYGYQFGQSNHSVYLLDAQRRGNPQLLANDWFTTQTLQYHAAFGWITHALMRVRLLETGFLASYLLLVALFHAAWLRLVLSIGGTSLTYILSVMLYHLSAGGTGLGMYQFFQDSSFLPSNVANVAMLWGIVLWSSGRIGAAGACFGVAGAFHLNHAVTAIILWTGLSAWRFIRGQLNWRRSFILGSALALLPCLINLAIVAHLKLSHGGGVSLDEFVDLYVRLRHPHHYDPRAWPIALWITFLWPMPLAVILARRLRHDAIVRELLRTSTILGGLILIALLFAGVWYVSESLVQMSLYRFSIYVHLLACTGAAMFVLRDGHGVTRRWTTGSMLAAVPVVLFAIWLIAPRMIPVVADLAPHRLAGLLLTAAICAVPAIAWIVNARRSLLTLAAAGMLLAVAVGWGRWSGVITAPATDDAEYIAMCRDIADRAIIPHDAIVLVPPSEMAFRLHAQRAIVVNFKGIPQLSSEMPEWRDRMQRVLNLPHLRPLQGSFLAALEQIERRYAALPDDMLIDTARHYDARYILATRRLGAQHDRALLLVSARAHYFLYDLHRVQDD